VAPLERPMSMVNGGMSSAATPRALADGYLDALTALDPILATHLGSAQGGDRMPDWSPEGIAAEADLARGTLAALSRAEAVEAALTQAGAVAGDAASSDLERRCGRLLRERLEAGLALEAAGDRLRALNSLGSPVQSARAVFLAMPTTTDDDWRTIAGRLTQVEPAYAGLRESLALGRDRGLLAGPAQVHTVIDQLATWGEGAGWFTTWTAAGCPDGLRPDMAAAAGQADAAVARMRQWLVQEYAPATVDVPDPVGRETYARQARSWTGADLDLDLDEAYAWGWDEVRRLDAEMYAGAEAVLPAATPLQAMAHLDEHGPAIEGVEAVREYLQQLLDDAVAAVDGIHMDLAEPVRRVEAMIAPAGTAAAPYYTRPTMDFSRPGRTWLPTMGRTRFPTWDLISTWYHEGVPGHHLQLAQWVYVAPQLSRYQSSIGGVSANLEGWALYAERLADELGMLPDAAARMGYLDAQQMRAVRVVIDIGMHLGLPIPADQGRGEPLAPGQHWTPALAREFFGRHSGRPADFLDSEIVRYLGLPGQAIGYKLGERAWLAGRAAAKASHESRGGVFDLKAWHMAALSQGSLGLDDLAAELALL
jgi:uncharacterized protein (DUF885 family)